jgi:hypothetical protein
MAANTMGRILAARPSLCVLCTLCVLCVVCVADVQTHDLEKTQVVITFNRDGSFIVDVSNDPRWLRDRMQSIPGPFADRIVLWVDGREIRPETVELIHGSETDIHRLHGRMPIDAKTLRWYYGLVIDPYPLTLRRADGRIVVEEIAGGAWSVPLDLSGQFRAPSWLSARITAIVFVVAILLAPPIVWLSRRRR